MEENLLYFYAFLLLISIAFFVKKKNRIIGRSNNIDPFSFFCVAFFFYSVTGSLGRFGAYNGDLSIPIYFYFIAFAGFVSLSLGYVTALKRCNPIVYTDSFKFRLLPNIKLYRSTEGMLMLISFTIILLLNFNSVLGLFTNFGSGVSYVDNRLRDARTSTTGITLFMGALFSLFLIGFPLYNIIKNRIISFFDFSLLLSYVLFSLTSGHRTDLITVLVAFLVIYNYLYKPIKIIYLMAIGLGSLSMLVAIGHLRSESNIKDIYLMILDLGPMVFNILDSGEFANTVETCYKLIEVSFSGESITYGMSWLNDLLMFVPSFIWPDRPLPLPEQFMITYYPEAPEGYGKAWFVLNSGFMAFDIFGVILEMYILGRILSKLYMFFMGRLNNGLFLLMYIYLLCYSVFVVRSSALGFVKNYFLDMSPFILIHYFSRRKTA